MLRSLRRWLGLHVGAIQGHTVAAGLLGAVQRRVGLLKQRSLRVLQWLAAFSAVLAFWPERS